MTNHHVGRKPKLSPYKEWEKKSNRKVMTQARGNSSSLFLPHNPDGPEGTYLRDNSRKKTYAEVIQDTNMVVGMRIPIPFNTLHMLCSMNSTYDVG